METELEALIEINRTLVHIAFWIKYIFVVFVIYHMIIGYGKLKNRR